ncbi:hypothetical protein E4U33_001675 [Claviceps sp. LM78 group G4]|nr:hypothetical protein E4U33_001675 [Claviceps sp. LM78 group G4]
MVGLQTLSPHQSSKCLLNSYLFESKPESVVVPRYLRQSKPGRLSMPRVARSLDKSQLLAFNKAISEEVALIQGPPGTGKTFTSNVILQSLVDTFGMPDLPDSPIIVVAQTNHAVDQLIKKYIDDRGSDTVVRLGRRGSDELKAFSLSERMYNSRNARGQSTKQFTTKLKSIVKCLENAGNQAIEVVDAETLKNFGVLSAAQYDSLGDDDEWESSGTQVQEKHDDPLSRWLGDTDLTPARHREEVKEEGHIKDRRWQSAQISFVPLEDSAAAFPNEGYAKHLLERSANLYDIRPEKRLYVYKYLLTKLRDIRNPRSGIVELLASYTENCKVMKDVKDMNRAQFILRAGFKVVACTATGLLKHKRIIAQLRPRVLLMEEAAEIREADTIAACLCFPTLEHLILLGDHQQLQPHANLHELSLDPYRINISMFERLIKIGLTHGTLLEQRRMIPPLREIVQLFYPNVIDSPSISKLPTSVPGVLQPLWWFQHDWQEMRSRIGSDCTTIENVMEARMIVLFVQYLVEIQSIHPARITMLTFYNGQARLIRGELARNACLARRAPPSEWSVRTVDGFQGEENDFILLSLVRGPNGVPGFLASGNRAIVALSRAKLGLYIFGHRDVLLRTPKSRQTWSEVIQMMRNSSGRTLRLIVDGEERRVGQPDDWASILRTSKLATSAAAQGSRQPAENIINPPHRSLMGRTSYGTNNPFETRSELDRAPVDAMMTMNGNLGAALSLRPESPPSAVARKAETLTLDFDTDLICLTDTVTIPLSLQLMDLRDLSLDTPALALEAADHDEALIQFSDDEDENDDGGGGGENMLSKAPIDLLE